MSRVRFAAPQHPSQVRNDRVQTLRDKQGRSAAETRELLDLLTERIAELEARLGD